MAEFAEVVHFRDPRKAADMPKLDDRWNLGMWPGMKLEVAELVQQEARIESLEIVYGKWLDDVKGTPEDPDAVRSRLVATQVNTYAREDVTQATPPIEASRVIVSQAATKTNANGQHDCLIARHDIREAFFHAKGSGRVVIISPKGLAPPGIGWKCGKAWYGTREASKCWRNEVADTLIKEGCKAVVVVAPMMFVSENHGFVTVCHGDDFVSSVSAAALAEVDRVLTAHFDTKILPRTGPTAYGGEVTEGKHLGRTIRWRPQGFEWESNSKHVEDMVTLYVYTDTDWAEDELTRKSVSCTVGRYGSHMIDCGVAEQSLVALSSGEAEFYGIVRAVATSKQTSQILEQIGMQSEMTIASDSSAARGMCTRTGSGKVRHLSIKELWIQESYRKKECQLVSVHTLLN